MSYISLRIAWEEPFNLKIYNDRQAQIASLSNVYACDPRFYVHDRDYALAPRKEHGHL
jgi:hypothetical protein